jgi:hypothetical protein
MCTKKAPAETPIKSGKYFLLTWPPSGTLPVGGVAYRDKSGAYIPWDDVPLQLLVQVQQHYVSRLEYYLIMGDSTEKVALARAQENLQVGDILTDKDGVHWKVTGGIKDKIEVDVASIDKAAPVFKTMDRTKALVVNRPEAKATNAKAETVESAVESPVQNVGLNDEVTEVDVKAKPIEKPMEKSVPSSVAIVESTTLEEQAEIFTKAFKSGLTKLVEKAMGKKSDMAAGSRALVAAIEEIENDWSGNRAIEKTFEGWEDLKYAIEEFDEVENETTGEFNKRRGKLWEAVTEGINDLNFLIDATVRSGFSERCSQFSKQEAESEECAKNIIVTIASCGYFSNSHNA